MNLFFNHFHPKMPLFLVFKLKEVKYGSEKFVNWYIKFPDIQKPYKGSKHLKNRKDLIYIITSYYIWVFYIISSIVIASVNPIIGVISILISPFIVAGYIYAFAYTEQEARKLFRKKQR